MEGRNFICSALVCLQMPTDHGTMLKLSSHKIIDLNFLEYLFIKINITKNT